MTMIKTISDYPLVAGEILRRDQVRKAIKARRGLSKYWLYFHPYCEIPSCTGFLRRSSNVIYSKKRGSNDDPEPTYAACDECYKEMFK